MKQTVRGSPTSACWARPLYAGEYTEACGGFLRSAKKPGSESGRDMKFERFTVKSREAIADSQGLAGKYGNPEIRPHHLLLVLLTQDQGVVASLLQHIEADVAALTRGAAKLVDELSKVSGGAQARVSNQPAVGIR